jgi:hypothetical protein
MTADASGATQDYSSGPEATRGARRPPARAVPSVLALRAILAALGLAGAVLLVVSTFVPVVEIRVLTTSELVSQDTTITGGDLHGIALVLVALFALLMLAGALRGARPAMAALAATGLLALGLVVGLDVPELDNTGQIARFYEDVSAGAATGFYLESLGAVLLLLSGGGLLVLTAEGVAERLQAVGSGLGALGRAGRDRAAGSARRRRTVAEEPSERDADEEPAGRED